MEEKLLKAYNNLKDDEIFKKVINAKEEFFENLEGLEEMIDEQYKANDKKIKILFAGPLAKLERYQNKIHGIQDVKIKAMVNNSGLFRKDPKRAYIKYLGVIK